MSNNSKTETFGELLLESIDDSLQILGQEPRLALYQYLVTMQALEKNDIPDHLEEFESGLKSALGGAAKVVQRLILRKLFLKIGAVFKETNDYEFTERVNEARRRFEILRQQHVSQKDPISPTRSKKGQVTS